ncbi:hypothetical protein CDAR_237111 [Caerostris darwini]|uniref:Uncharacterized protein n=1 Tax=Caerostris darwini TaxID=1538125 RepID=A0AAV4W231_9ARAC|nr:hypothetical protein CDAR_237111 [Caerostris darwini]
MRNPSHAFLSTPSESTSFMQTGDKYPRRNLDGKVLLPFFFLILSTINYARAECNKEGLDAVRFVTRGRFLLLLQSSDLMEVNGWAVTCASY